MNCFSFFSLYFLVIFSFFFTVLVVHPYHDHSPMARYCLFVLKVPLNTNQSTYNDNNNNNCISCFVISSAYQYFDVI